MQSKYDSLRLLVQMKAMLTSTGAINADMRCENLIRKW